MTARVTPRTQIFHDIDSDGDRVEVWSTNKPEIALAIAIDGTTRKREASYFHVPTLREALDEHYPAKDVEEGSDEPAQALDDVKVEDVADVETIARFMAARMILDPMGTHALPVAEIVAMADLIEG